MRKLFLAATALSVLTCSISGFAAVSADEASKLKTTLTPLGGDKAANADGSIPAWDGKASVASTPTVGDIPSQPFPGEQPVLQISAQNMSSYADKLSEGTQALLKKYPNSFRVDVYPTHRTAVASQSVYDNTFKNATSCKTKAGGNSVEGCFGGIPFPIPKDGVEAIWNYLLRIEPEATDVKFQNFVITADGTRTLATQNEQTNQYPYYYKDGSVEKWNGEYWLNRFSTVAPPFKAGESLVLRDSVDTSTARQTWQYLVGQRRVRKAPTVAYDTPDFVSSGANYFDEVMGFMGSPDRFQWKLVGKREMYVPYNTNALVTSKDNDAFAKFHMNPDKLRWELHRVWELEATVVAGKHHAVPKRRYYLDEDTWLLVLADGYDSEGKLWRTTQGLPFVVPSVPAVLNKPVAIFDLQKGTMSSVQFLQTLRVLPQRKPESYFTGDSVAADAAR
ncbi:DUF1329 domain-containing protein [Pseudomonas citronellolis]|uniref:DUF1329 domain-containing protein n=1 Tax=Pseudomonas citronellolis TaxID=53408 RepID=UPI000853648C|nr:DUF1329 domain-containing protein [Pseudomonas humi]